MKIYKTTVLAESARLDDAQRIIRDNPGATAWGIHNKYGVYQYRVTLRKSFSHNVVLTDKQIAKLLPTWAKHRALPNIGAKVAAFYRENNKVICRLHECGGLIGSQEYYDWQETQPDCWRTTDAYRRSIGTNHAFN